MLWLLMRRPALALIATVASLAAGAVGGASAQAATVPVRFGIGDQHTAMFSDARWSALGVRITRYNVPWDAADDAPELARAVAFVQAAREQGVETLLHLTGNIVDGTREPLPSRVQYRRAVRALVAVFRPLGVRTWGAWNEANHPTQATFGRPDRAAEFFLELRAACSGCTVVAMDLLTQGSARSTGVASYRGFTGRFFRALGSRASLVRVIGIHNYGDLTMAKGASISRDLITYAKRYDRHARFWLTESGGIAANRSRPCSEARQTLGTRRMFSQAATLAPFGVDRLYLYNWTADSCEDQHDSGMIREDGTARPALAVVERGARTFRR